MNYDKTPFPYFGGKADAAPAVWQALGDVAHYVEPFFGSGAVLIRRPHMANRAYHSETVNDADGLLVNFFRAMVADPDAVAEAASWPVSEVDMMARQLELVRWQRERMPEIFRANAHAYDATMAGWWAWGLSGWIGSGWCGPGPWYVGDDGRIARRAGKGAKGVRSRLPYVSGDGQGVAGPQMREATEPVGVRSQLPELGNNGQGVAGPQMREATEPVIVPADWRTMPRLRAWLHHLAARLRHVRICHGDWSRVVTGGALKTLSVRQGHGACGVFLDPPYGTEADRDTVYRVDSHDVAKDVRAWCADNGNDRDYRIVLAGFDGEHNELEALGWTAVEWYRNGFLKGGMGNIAGTSQQHRERLWLSPHCLRPQARGQVRLFV